MDLNARVDGKLWTERRKDGWTDGLTDGRMDLRMDGKPDAYIAPS